MTFLITGGRSQTGLATARYLKDAGKNVVIGSRNGLVLDGYDSVKLDWDVPSTLEAPFANGQTYQGVYLVSPLGLGVVDICKNTIAFIDVAVKHGVSRFVLLSGSMVDKAGEYGVAKVHQYLEEKKLDHFVLQPTMFMDNFLLTYAKGIREKDVIETDTPNAKVPMISVKDIGRFAAEALLKDKIDITEMKVLGPELVTFDQAAEVLTRVLGRTITHQVVPPEKVVENYVSIPKLGWSKEFAQFVVMAGGAVDAGSEERLFGLPNTLFGEETFEQWAERFESSFAPST
ncbi:NmrA family protein [Ephemerocybe angulata]|uniref:NmrA family protein n=1 Tax=Ephemerocybe angulata TaxID=980116 RepID=A0A8H6HF66_9AGAR|nr:NmrA family protein [Tulosesus angulatus]